MDCAYSINAYGLCFISAILFYLLTQCLDTDCLFYARSITASLPICPPRGEHDVLNQTVHTCAPIVYDKRTYTD